MRYDISVCISAAVSAQVCFARSHCLGGVGLWDVDGDSYGELLGAVGRAVLGDPAICTEYSPPECTNTGKGARV